jgi:PKD repeat protein
LGLAERRILFSGVTQMNIQGQKLMGTVILANLILCTAVFAAGEIIIDNGDEGTKSTGRWYESGAAGSYGTTSVYSGNQRQYTWTFDCPEDGEYIVSMWWTEWPSRAKRVKVLVHSDAGIKKLYVNQRVDGGKWNSLGKFLFTGGIKYDVTLVAAPGNVTSCADAVKFVKFNPPVADFWADHYRGPAPFTVKFTNNTSGKVQGWKWDFGDGHTSTEKNPTHTYTKPGTHSVTLTAIGEEGSDTKLKYCYIDVKAHATENIYVCDGYGGNDYLSTDIKDKMWAMGARQTSYGWTYKPAGSAMTYNVYLLKNGDALRDALYEDNSHMIIGGHANYGFGLLFANSKEIVAHQIDDYDCVDSGRLFNYSTDWVAARIDGMKYGQAYPNWKPEFHDGTSAVMPYDFGDPRGNPPYNYCLTYQLPGDPTYYRVEVDGKPVERYPDSGAAAWYSPDGQGPDPSVDRACYLTNTSPYYNRFDCIGEWVIKKYNQPGHPQEERAMNYNYCSQWPDSTGKKSAKWSMVVKRGGQYRVMATWPALPEHASNARYTIHHAGGASTVYADQRTTAGRNSLGVFYFNAGLATVELSAKANGYVAADEMILRPMADAEKILCAEFSVDKQSGSAPMRVTFKNRSHHYTYDGSADVAGWEWDFGDGTTSTEKDPSHTYTAKGVYTVKLKVTTTDGRQDVEEKVNCIVVDDKCRPQAQFYASTLQGMGTMSVQFHDQSCGEIDRWYWDFGDGESSQEKNPLHTYKQPGRYSVRLRVYGPGGRSVEIEEGYVHVFMGECYTDNSFRHRPHYTSTASSAGKVLCYAGPSSIDRSKLKYARLFHSSCNSLPYFGQTFNRGVMYGKLNDVALEHDTAVNYLELYMEGHSDGYILEQLNKLEDIHVYYNFDEKPPSVIKDEAYGSVSGS